MKAPRQQLQEHRSNFLAGGGEMGARVREFDWSATSLGPRERWPQSLRSAISILLASRAQIVLFWGPKLVALYNDAYARVLGSKHPWALGKPASQCLSEIWDDNLGPLVQGVLQTGEAFYAQDHAFVVERHGYPEETYFDVSYDPVRAEDGAVGGILCIVSETTGRVLERRRLQTLRALSDPSFSEPMSDTEACQAAARALGERNPDVPFALIYLVDTERKTARLAAAAGIEKGLAYSPLKVPLGCNSNGSAWPLESVISSNSARLIDTTQIPNLPSGTCGDPPPSCLVLPISAPGQNLPTGLLVAAVSPRLPLDDSYRNFYQTITGHISTALANARAHEAERKRADVLTELDRAKTAFFSNVSHEFRTPLTLMLGPLSDILSGDLDPARRQELEVVQRNGVRLLKLVNTLLDFSRIEAGRIRAVYEPIDLAAYTAELASVFRSAIERAGMRLVIDCPPLDEPIYVDRAMWETIVLNLLSNAFKFTFEGVITVSLHAVNGHAELVVRDTGVGIPAEELLHIFDRFHRVKGVSGRSCEGSGIGLALVQELAKLHGGTARVESEVGQGSAFIVSIPLGKAHLPADHIGVPRTLASPCLRGDAYIEEALRWLPIQNAECRMPNEGRFAEDASPGQTTQRSAFGAPHSRILLADDNADMREYLRRLLAGQYEVEAVADGEEALKAARECAFDLILTDVMMPRLDGFGFLRELRHDERTRQIPVILLSARAGEASKVEGLEAGADDYLVKPFSARELLASIEARLQIQQVRRESQDALLASERKFSAAFNQSPLPMIITSLDDRRVTEVNESFVRLSGHTREEAVGHTSGELRLLADWEQRDAALKAIRAGERVYRFEARCLTKSGEERIGMVISSVVEINSRPYLLHSFTDLTERKRGEQALAEGARQQQALYRLADHLHRARSLDDVYNAALDAILSALDSDGAAVLLFDEAGTMRFAGWRGLSDCYRKALEGLPPWKPDGKYPEQICINDVDVAEIDDSLKAVIKSEGIGALSFSSLVSRGKRIGKLMTYFNAPHAFSDDEQRLSLTIARQLAFGIDRKRNEELLRQNAAQLTLITNTAPVFLAHLDAQARFKFVNKTYADMFGLTPEDFIGKSLPESIGPEAYESLRPYIEIALSGKPVELEVEVPYAAIGRHFMHSSYAPEFDSSGKVVGFVAAIADISQRKWAEQEIARLLADERSAREVAEHATRAKDEFLAIVSHELRSPLNSILGWNRLLRSQWRDNPEIAKVAEAVERSGKAQLQLIEDLLDTARIISGKMKLEFQPVEPVAVITAALDIIRPAADSKGVVIATDLDPNPGQITGDPDRLQQVIWNLLSNAIKFTPGGGLVQVVLRRSGAGVEIVVRDTGQGISPDLLPYVFDRFKQGDSTVSRRYGGLGLGLALVKHLVELHGGTVAVESPGEGMGANFTVNLPVRAVKADRGTEGAKGAETAARRRARGRSQIARLEGLAALVVDDDPGARELLAATLERYGVLVTSVGSAEAALGVLESRFEDEATGPFDILISDIGMPAADGYELMRLVRAHADRRLSRIPAIALTAYARTEDRLRALQAGFQMHVPKPVDEEELTTVIAALTDRI